MRNHHCRISLAVALLMTLSLNLSAQSTTLLNENFDNISSGVPAGWNNSNYDCYTTLKWQSNANGYGGSRGLCFYANSANGKFSTLMTPALNLYIHSSLRFKYRNFSSDNILSVYISFDGGATFSTPIATNLTTSSADDWAEAELSLADYTGYSNVKIVFKGEGNGGSYAQFLDDVVIESLPMCQSPTALSISNMHADSATLNWSLSLLGDSPDFFQLRVSDPNQSYIVNSDSIPGSSTSYHFSDLSPSTTYTVFMRSDCNSRLGGYSRYESLSFTTDSIGHQSPTCPAPQQLRAYNQTATSVDLAWSSSSAAQHIIYITDPYGNISRQVVSSNPCTIANLLPYSTYSFNVRALCAANDSSALSPLASATTLCAVLPSADWSEGAEGTSGTSLPDCWSYGYFNRPSSGTTFAQPFISQSSCKHSGNRAFKLRNMVQGTTSYLSSQAFTVDSANQYLLSIWIYRPLGYSYPGEGLDLYISSNPDSISGAEHLGFINHYTHNTPIESRGAGWYNYTYPISSTGTLYLIVKGVSMQGSDIFFDDITVTPIPSCYPPGDISITPTMSDVTLNWFAGQSAESSWTLAYSLSSDSALVASDSLVVNTPSYTISGINPASTYTLSARLYARCSSSDISLPTDLSTSFATPCATVTSLPFLQDFEDMTPNTTPDCWNISGSTSSTALSTPYYVWGVYQYSDNKMLRMYNQGVQVGSALVNTQLITIPSQPSELQFDYSHRASCGLLYLKISTDNGASFADLASFNTTDSYDKSDPGTFSRATIDLSSYAGQTVFFQFYANAHLTAGAIFLDNFTVRLTPACREISDFITISDITNNSARVSIRDTTATSWDISYGAPDIDPDSGTIITVSNSLNYTISGLAFDSSYVVYLRRNCSNSLHSSWSVAYSFHTTFTPDSLPCVTNFEDPADDDDWHIVNGKNIANHFTIGSDANAVCAGSRALYIENDSAYGYSITSSTCTYAFRTLYLPAGTTHFSFNWKCTGGESNSDFCRVMLVPSTEPLKGNYGLTIYSRSFPYCIRAFTPAGKDYMNLTSGDANGWNLYEADVTLTPDSAGIYNFVIMWNNDSQYGMNYPIAIDNVSIGETTCSTPSIIASAITASTATLTANSTETQNIEVVASSTPIYLYQTISGDLYHGITSAPVVIDSLQPNSTFYFTARAICGAGDTSRWATVQSARTACGTFNIPYTEDFEDASALTCWSYITAAPVRTTLYRYSGTFSCKFTDGTAISPELNVSSLSDYTLIGHAYATSDSTSFYVGAMVDPTDASTFEILTAVVIPARNTWTDFTADFSLLTDPDYADFADAQHFVIIAASGDTVYLDDLYLGSAPTCSAPSAVNVSNVTSTSCQVAWTDNATNCTQWIVKATPTTSGAQTITQLVTSNPATITDLIPATTYSLSVAALCSATGTSFWALGGSFTTDCAAINAPYSEDFESHSVAQTPHCWYLSDTSAYSNVNIASSVWGVHTCDGNQMIRLLNDVVNGQNAIISPAITLDSTRIYHFCFDYCNQSNNDSLRVDISSNGGTTWSNIGSYSGSAGDGNIPASWTTVSYNLASYAGNSIIFRFSNAGIRGYGAIFVDNIKVHTPRSCADVASVSGNIGVNDATISISDSLSSHWQYIYGVKGFDSTALSPTLISTDTFSISGLSASTDYTLYVRAYCDSANQSCWKPFNFRTSSLPATLPYLCDFTDPDENNAWNIRFCGTNAFTIGSDQTAALYVANNGSYGYDNSVVSNSCAYRLINFDASQYNIHFSWKCTGGRYYYDYARFYLLPVTSTPPLPPYGAYSASKWPSNIIPLDGGSYVNSRTFPEWNDVDTIVDMSAAPGDYYLVFCWSNYYFNGTNYPLAVNDIQISELSCVAPVISVDQNSISNSSAVVDYTLSTGSGTIRYWYNYTGNPADSANIATATASPITLTGLDSARTYYFYMQKACSESDSSTIASARFRTLGTLNDLPYVCDFEDAYQSSLWQFTQDASNYFVTGDATSNGGSNSLYITNDGTSNSYYVRSSAVSFAYRSLQLPAALFQFSYDWKAFGESNYDYARVFLVPDDETFTAGTKPSGVSTTGTPSGWIALDNNAKLNLDSTWKTLSDTFSLSLAGDYKMLFIWINDQSSGANPPLAIDNIRLSQIVTAPTLQDTICANTPYYTGYGFNIPASSLREGAVNTFTRTATGAVDTLITLELYVYPTITSLSYDTLCQGDTLHWGGYSIPDPTTRIYALPPLTAVNGCDSFVTKVLTVTPVSVTDLYGDACEGIPYYNHGISGMLFTGDTVISTTLKGAYQCDSLVNVHITYHPTERSDTDVYIKYGDSFTWHGNTYTTAGDYTVTLQTIYGCDSVVTLHLYVYGTSVDDVSDINIEILPNPVTAGATAYIYGNFGEVLTVEILNSLGQVIARFEPKSYPIELPAIPASGLYYIRLTTSPVQTEHAPSLTLPLRKLVVK